MKKTFYSCLFFFVAALLPSAYAQNGLSGISYQAVARNANGSVLAGQALTVRLLGTAPKGIGVQGASADGTAVMARSGTGTAVAASSISGIAGRFELINADAGNADPAKIQPGQVIGKALQEHAAGNGKINVLVNVK